MASTYLARITSLCSDMAVKLSATASRSDRAGRQRDVGEGSNKNIEDYRGHSLSSREAGLQRSATYPMKLRSIVDGIVGEDVIDEFDLVHFVRELDALRLRMVGAALYERFEVMPERLVIDVGCDAVTPALAQDPDSEAPRQSIQDAIADAVFLLEHRGEVVQ